MKQSMKIIFTVVWCVGLLLSFGEYDVQASASPLDSAVAIWHMDGAGNGKGGSIAAVGKVKLGVELKGDELKAALQRGGSGKVAEFDGGYLRTGNESGQAPNLNGSKQMTFYIRMRDPEGLWDAPLFSTDNKAEDSSEILYTGIIDWQIGAREMKRTKSERKLNYLWQTEPLEKRVLPEYIEKDPSGFFKQLTSHKEDARNFLKGILRVGVPVGLINPAAWHDIIVRFTGPRLEMFIDGVLVDEEFPQGTVQNFKGPFLIGAGYDNGQLKSGFHGQVDHVALWDRAITDKEIETLSGGEKEVARRDVEILGKKSDEIEGSQLQYWRPRGYNTFVGDCMTFSHDGVFHVFYLLCRKHGTAKWGMGACSWGHISTRDLVHWKVEPVAIPITEQTECALGTGYVIFHKGTYYAFYIQHGRRCLYKDAPYPSDNIFVATSEDGIHFKKNPKPVASPAYRGKSDINPIVFADASDQHFFMNLNGWYNYTSDDLLNWVPTSIPALSVEGMCPNIFDWNGWYYYNAMGYYRMSKTPAEIAHWVYNGENQGLHDGLAVPMVSRFKDRYILAGFDTGGGSYAHEMVFREVLQQKDGTLGMKWPAELIPKTGAALNLSSKPLSGAVSGEGNLIRLSATSGLPAAAMLTDVPQNVRITLRVKPSPGVQKFGLFCRGEGETPNGTEIQFEPSTGIVKGGNSIPSDPTDKAKMERVLTLKNVRGLDQPFTLDVIIKDNIVDFCIDNRRTGILTVNEYGDAAYVQEMTTGHAKGRLFFYAENGQVTFDDIQIRPLVEK